ncbi:UNVERIFIED_CONTAM: Phosphate transporter [Sesamum angustifolium]|uniref:Phosphate transporter n=1 Tax=Sesamum angustifolium TaxID=2727405 RepID=A0AAW2NJ62_9LAMI
MAGSIRGLQPTQETAERSLEVQTESRIAIISGACGPTTLPDEEANHVQGIQRADGPEGIPRKNEDEVILVIAVEQEGSDYRYQTMFLRSSEEGGEYELVFFRKLDEEFNKVVKFYKGKVEEVKKEAEQLSKQMDALIALRIRVDKPYVGVGHGFGPAEVRVAAPAGNSAPATVIASVNGVKQVEMSTEGNSVGEQASAEKNRKDSRSFRPASIDVLDHVKINVDPDTPVSTLRNVIKSSKSDPSFSKEELTKAEEKLRKAFVEFYQQLRLLKSYCFLNMLAFSKIMKKYDKITSRSASKSYLEMVDKSYLAPLMRKGMKSLRPGHKKERHRTTFFLGLFTGCSIALVAAIIVSIHARNLLNHEGRGQYMDNIFPLYRVNYPFIFGFKPGTELGFREVFLLASGLSVLALAAVLSNLDMEMDPRTQSFEALTELVPLGLVTVVLLITFCPFNIISFKPVFSPSVRMGTVFVLHCTRPVNKPGSGFQKFAILCLLLRWGDFKKRSNRCLESNVYEILYIVVAIIPFWSRALQCLRRLFEEKDTMQGLNCLKYFSTVVALVMRTIYDLRRGPFWKVMAASTSGVTTIYSTYWDIVIDWGLLQRNARNPWLRDKLLISNKAVYFVAIVVNILLRLVWMQLVLDFNEAPFLHRRAMVAVVACLEILRRGIWNFFRLENEHFNNVGKYRAFKSVPLPFHYEDEKIM